MTIKLPGGSPKCQRSNDFARLLSGRQFHRPEIGSVEDSPGLGQGVLLNPVRPDVVRMMPPLTITADEVDAGVDRLEAAVREVAAR